MSVVLQVVKQQLPSGGFTLLVKADHAGAVLLGALASVKALLSIPDFVEFHPHAVHFIEISEAIMKGEPAPAKLIVPA